MLGLSTLVEIVSAQEAKKGLSCFGLGKVTSQALFGNTGTFAGKGPAFSTVASCLHQETGLFVDFFGLLPLRGKGGREIDLRVGDEFEALGLTFAVSGAGYAYVIEGAGNFHTFDARLKVSRGFSLVEDVSYLNLWGEVDYQRLLTPGKNWLSIATGATLSTKLGLPGDPTLVLGVGVWKWLDTTAPGDGPVWGLNGELLFPVSKKGKIRVGPFLQAGYNGVDDIHQFRVSGGAVVRTQVKFLE
ncbi:hypothetical protein HY416_00310 [Candidatus Kaiserbacteria bacterium]|nr:hypothetical protein [Candidatus Kaiserbacteria bacterium]